jgi:hypothetical protein
VDGALHHSSDGGRNEGIVSEKLEPVPPIIALGTKILYLHAADTVDEAVRHAGNRFQDSPDLNEVVDFFDVAGRQLKLLGTPGQPDALSVTDSTDHSDKIREQARSVIAKRTEDDTLGPRGQAALEELIRAVDQVKTLEELGEALATALREPEDATPDKPAMTTESRVQPIDIFDRGSWLHNTFCH